MTDSREELAEGAAAGGARDLGSSVLRSRGGKYKAEGPSDSDYTEPENRYQSGSTESLSERILAALTSDILACDVQMSLFVGAARSYRYDSILSPFPPPFIIPPATKDIQGIQDALLTIPPLNCLKWQLQQGSCKLSLNQLELLVWIFEGGPSKLTLKSVPKEERLAVLERVGSSHKGHSPPAHLLQVSTTATPRWETRCLNESTFYAYHGSRLDNWFSILHAGLQQHRTKTALFGEGIYLSSELGVSLNYSRCGVGWESSVLGRSISCMSVAQIINHPSVKIHHEDASRGRVAGSEGGSLPESYILVRDNQLLHNRYLLVYSNESGSAGSKPSVPRNRLSQWVSSHRLLLLLACYGLLLLGVGLSNSVWIRRWLRKQGFVA